ncbi:MAG: SAM-dependent methyltransferase [Candidatus Krumholzibacteria bacterium]|nr:SAM-dependent methyltransferase [Candidatus Krumholzibacteria bacterium]
MNRRYAEEYDLLIGSGLYDDLTRSGLLVRHEEADLSLAAADGAYRVLRPDTVPFISYPHEWCFSQLKDAALTTVAIQKRALEHGMSLKDCSAFNVQFNRGRPVFIDTLSFERFVEGRPWAAYRQFCQHFLAPLALARYRDIRLVQLFRVYLDGIPLDLASELLPLRTRFSPSLLMHIHMHARFQSRYGSRTEKPSGRGTVGFKAQMGLVESLESAVAGATWKASGTEWVEYYEDTNYSRPGLDDKERLVAEYIDAIGPGVVWDLGANTGRFSRIASDRGHGVISFDIDAAAVEKNYLELASDGDGDILPLVLDLANPTSGMGWAGEERKSLEERGPAEIVMALALIHHLAISDNLPFDVIAGFFSRICRHLIVEYIPKEDSQVRRLLVCREDIFGSYTREEFEKAFRRFFRIERAERITDSERVLYLMRRNGEMQ